MKFFLTLIVASLLARHSHAALVAYDGFEGSAGSLSGSVTGTGWQNAWAGPPATTVVSATLTYSSGEIHLNGGPLAVRISPDNDDAAAARQFTNTTSSEIWFSFLFQPNGLSENDNDFIQFRVGSQNSQTNSASIGDLSNFDGQNTFRVRIGSDTTSAGSLSIVDGATYFLVGRISTDGPQATNYDQIDLWVNPSTLDLANLGAPNQSITGNLGVAPATGLSWFGVRTNALDAADSYLFDELRIGTSYASVVPEPGRAGLALASVLLLFLRRRRPVVFPLEHYEKTGSGGMKQV